MSGLVISTNRAQCRDCYRCIRTCHVKAVRVRGGQAEVAAERCISCGRCVLACPQHAKIIRDDLGAVRQLLAEAARRGERVIASVAPSAPSYLAVQSFAEIRQLLRALGFAEASETALGAELVAAECARILTANPDAGPLVATACPVVVSLVEKYHADLLGNLAPVVSPMIAHARWLKAHYGSSTRVVFVGPCAAKKAEAADEEVAGAVDAVLTFAELERWIEEEGPMPEQAVDTESGRTVTARLFPLEGGLLRTARLSTDVLAADTVVATGLEACEEALDAIRAGVLQARMVELMACPSGCINGPAIPKGESVFVRKQKILRFARQSDSSPVDREGIDLARAFRDESLRLSPIPTGIIQDLLARIEKYSEADELNCSACGYNTCREKAQATYWGMAEISMCVPYMRKRAESLANLVMDVVPSAVVVLDYQLRIQEASPSAEKLLGCRRQQVVGRYLDEFIPSATFKEVQSSSRQVLGRRQRYRDDLIVKEFVVPVPRSNLIVGIVEDVTREEMQQAELTRIREATIERAQEVITKQIRVAHEIASLLGETTAETKVQLSRMIEVIRGPDGHDAPSGEA